MATASVSQLDSLVPEEHEREVTAQPTDRESVEMKMGADEPAIESDSEADEKLAAKIPRISEKRQADNFKFSAW